MPEFAPVACFALDFGFGARACDAFEAERDDALRASLPMRGCAAAVLEYRREKEPCLRAAVEEAPERAALALC